MERFVEDGGPDPPNLDGRPIQDKTQQMDRVRPKIAPKPALRTTNPQRRQTFSGSAASGASMPKPVPPPKPRKYTQHRHSVHGAESIDTTRTRTREATHSPSMTSVAASICSPPPSTTAAHDPCALHDGKSMEEACGINDGGCDSGRAFAGCAPSDEGEGTIVLDAGATRNDDAAGRNTFADNSGEVAGNDALLPVTVEPPSNADGPPRPVAAPRPIEAPPPPPPLPPLLVPPPFIPPLFVQDVNAIVAVAPPPEIVRPSVGDVLASLDILRSPRPREIRVKEEVGVTAMQSSTEAISSRRVLSCVLHREACIAAATTTTTTTTTLLHTPFLHGFWMLIRGVAGCSTKEPVIG
eukprot:m.734924 g.734924  ORF g.734924 m.734924 type:complete len:353 (+) comp23086_c1_seq2:462-1520(+)